MKHVRRRIGLIFVAVLVISHLCTSVPAATIDTVSFSEESGQLKSSGIDGYNSYSGYKGQDAVTDSKSSNETIELQALHIKDCYVGGKIFEDVSEKFVKSFQDKVAALTIPDARKGERAPDIREGYESWSKSPIIFLNSIPEKNIYLYGYNDAKYPGYGLILDIGEEQHIYSFPYRYMTNTTLAPDLSANKDGNKIYVSCHTGCGTGVSVSELYVFQENNNKIEPFYVDINNLIEHLNNKIRMTYDSKSKNVTVYSEGKQIATDSLVSVDVIDGAVVTPKSFYCGDHIDYILNGDTLKVTFIPTIYIKEQLGAQSYLKNVSSFEADISFTYDSNGFIIGFDIGEITTVK